MSFGECIVYLQCLQRGLLGSWKSFLWRRKVPAPKQTVRISQAGVSQSVGGVFFDGLLEVLDGPVESLLGSLGQPVAASQIVLIGIGIGGVALGHAPFFLAGQPHP